MLPLAVALLLAGPARGRGERLATRALQAAAPPAESLADARRALSLTAEFDPTDFVKAGRKGEVVEDESCPPAARTAGTARSSTRPWGRPWRAPETSGRPRGTCAARSCWSRAKSGSRAWPGRSWPWTARPRPCASSWRRRRRPPFSPASLALVEEAANAAGLPSAQLEIDRVRLPAAAAEAVYRDGPFRVPENARLSTGAPLRLDEGLVVLYAAEGTCRSCSADLEELKRAVPAGVRVVLVPEAPDRDQALRQVLSLYRYTWPIFVARGAWTDLGLEPRSVLVVARGGWAGAIVKPPFLPALSAVLGVFGKVDIRETIPRRSWNGRPVDRRPAPSPPTLLPEGLAPGEDEPAPAEFDSAVAALRAGRPAEALRTFEALEGRGDGWLLPPEARLDRALSLAALGRREEARRLLLRIGDSRFQEDVDRALERVGSPR
jgi:hypothetical protein